MNKKLLLLGIPALLLASCGYQPKTYTFEVIEHFIGRQITENQENPYDLYLAKCKTYGFINQACVEVPWGDTRTTLQLRYIGYKILYEHKDEHGRYDQSSNYGWELA